MTEQEAQAEAERRWPRLMLNTISYTAAPQNYGQSAQRAAFEAGAAWERSRLSSRVVEAAPSDTDREALEALLTEFSNYERGMDAGDFKINDHMFVDFEFWDRLLALLRVSQPVQDEVTDDMVERAAEAILAEATEVLGARPTAKGVELAHTYARTALTAALGGGE